MHKYQHVFTQMHMMHAFSNSVLLSSFCLVSQCYQYIGIPMLSVLSLLPVFYSHLYYIPPSHIRITATPVMSNPTDNPQVKLSTWINQEMLVVFENL